MEEVQFDSVGPFRWASTTVHFAFPPVVIRPVLFARAQRPVTGSDGSLPFETCGCVPILRPPSPRMFDHHAAAPRTTVLYSHACLPTRHRHPESSWRLIDRQAYEVRESDPHARFTASDGNFLHRGDGGATPARCWRCSIVAWRRARRGCGSQAPRGTAGRWGSPSGSWRRGPRQSPSTSAWL
jgi:hypothetical protein